MEKRIHMKENAGALKEDIDGGAVCTADGCIGDFAPEHVCSVVADTTPTRKKINNFFSKLEENIKALKEGKDIEPIEYESRAGGYTKQNDYIRNFDCGGAVRYPGDEDYVKLQSEWREKRKPIHDKKINTTSFETFPNRTHRIGDINTYSTFDDGREDDFLAWYEDHKNETSKPKLNESFEDVNADLYVVIPVGIDAVERLGIWYSDAHGFVDEDDAYLIRADELSDLCDEFGPEELEIYECTQDIIEEPDDFYASRDDLTSADDKFRH